MQSCCGGSSRFSGQIRLMRRPELARTRRSATAATAELERQRERERARGRRRMTEGENRRRPRSSLFIGKGRPGRCEKRGDWILLSSDPDASGFWTISKGKDPLKI